MGEVPRRRGCAGCGKTTLLSILAGSVSSLSRASRVSGTITLDGQLRRSWASRMIAYVPQFDFLLPTLTVAETLRYSAQLRLPASARRAEVEVRARPTSPAAAVPPVVASMKPTTRQPRGSWEAAGSSPQ